MLGIKCWWKSPLDSTSLIFEQTPWRRIKTDIFSLFSIFSFKLTHYNLHDDLIGAKNVDHHFFARTFNNSFISERSFCPSIHIQSLFISLSFTHFSLCGYFWAYVCAVCVDAVNCNQMWKMLFFVYVHFVTRLEKKYKKNFIQSFFLSLFLSLSLSFSLSLSVFLSLSLSFFLYGYHPIHPPTNTLPFRHWACLCKQANHFYLQFNYDWQSTRQLLRPQRLGPTRGNPQLLQYLQFIYLDVPMCQLNIFHSLTPLHYYI